MATEREIEAEAYIAGMEHGLERGMSNPTPKLTAAKHMFCERCGPAAANLQAVATRQAFEEAFRDMQRAFMSSTPLSDLERLVEKYHALAKEKPDGT
ncbi:MAG: hypothetical protein V3S55_09365 [Nitrospiraceae bacterium]